MTWRMRSKVAVFMWCFMLTYGEIGNRLHHSNYRVSHHMGKMKIKANPEGADFDFSGGDLHVDLHPAHSDIVPIYNYFHSDYHEYHVQPVEHHIEHEHHSGDGEHHEMDHHGEDEEGYTRSLGYHHEHEHHNHYNHHEMEPYEHHHLHHDRYHDNDERHSDMHHEEHHSGDHMDHHMDHHHEGHHMNEEEEIAADHGHHDMPHVFPIGMGHGGAGHHGSSEVGHHEGHGGGGGEMHHGSYDGGGYGGDGGGYGGGGYGGGGYGGGGGGMHHGGYGGGGYGGGGGGVHHADFHPGNIHHNREEQWGHNMGHVGGGDYGGGGGHGGGGGYGGGHGGWCKRSDVNGNCLIRQGEKTENGEERDFLIKPIGLKGSIREKFKKHWDEEEKEEGEEKESHENDEDNDDEDNDKDDDKHVVRHHHRRLHHHHHDDDTEPSKPDDDGKPTSEEFMRVYNYAKKIYPGEDDSSGDGGNEKVEPVYKINDKLSAREEQLAKDIERMEAIRKSKRREEQLRREKERDEREERERKRKRIKLMERKLEEEKEEKKKEEEEEKRRHEKEERDMKEKKKEEESSKDDVEKDIETREKEIQREQEKAYGSIEKAERDNKSSDGENTEEKDEKSRQNTGALRWNEDKEDSVHSPSHKSHLHEREDSETAEKSHDEREENRDEDKGNEKSEEEGEDRDNPRKEVSDDDDMDDGERRQHDFHDMISHVKPKSLHSLERPHEGVEKFGGKDEEIDINDKTQEGDIDQMEVQRKLEEGKNELPIQDQREGEQLKELANTYTPPMNAKPETDRQQSSMYEQNQDVKLEGADHEFYHDRPNYAAMNHHDDGEREIENNHNDEDQDKRHELNLAEPVKISHSNEDITERPHSEEDVDKKVLGDFKSRFNEETSFQSVEQAEELFNQLQDAALSNQKKLDGQQTSGSVTDNGLVSAGPHNHAMYQTHATKRHNLADHNSYKSTAQFFSGNKIQKVNQVDKDKRQNLLFSKFFVAAQHKQPSRNKRFYKIYSRRNHIIKGTDNSKELIPNRVDNATVPISVRIPVFRRRK
ncbi:sarcoplasmic reticulum histidine-rich calcium-binding protein-like isoform X2 [Hydractinia symbiolongicarpus]|uniref:sarcoplasmic reticulum histidine-rich calcium-binding protein-like isoform X2 n=1 Tax=Hydractinia symbiolongicarpus TaxID=13093 RepID=UPI00254DBCB8|nr:sarcoplasmic reticulum histidine-rich calcium-binding protein-like isoform X2 [Hydractinia symbiolongicarpus]